MIKLSSSMIQKIPKVEFHRHLDGSVRLETIDFLNKQNNLGIKYSSLEDLRSKAFVSEPLNSLTEVLNKFSITQKTLCHYDAIKRVAFENVEDAYQDGCKLIELRFAPLYMLKGKNLTYEEVIEAIIDGTKEGEEKFNIKVGLIYIQPRGFSTQECLDDLDRLNSFLVKKGKYQEYILGFDLADEEDKETILRFVPVINKAKEMGLKITVHSGEDTSHQMVDQTLTSYSPLRIGHGIKSHESEQTMKDLIEQDVCLEVCVHSNYLTKAFKVKENHPIKLFKEKNVPFNISSDDPHILSTNLISEYTFIHENFGFSGDDFFKINKNNLRHSFLPIDKIKEIEKNYFI